MNSKWVLFAFLGILTFFLFTEHRAHLYGFLPYIFLLACPLMHLFHHRGHGGHHHDGTITSSSQKQKPEGGHS